MKKSELKQIIKEEILKVLSESHKPGDKVIIGGLGTVTIDREENDLIYFTDKNGKKYKRNYAQFKKETQGWNKLNESPYPLIPRKFLITQLIKDNDLENEFKVNFIESGNPSEYFLEQVVNDLKEKYRIDVSSIFKPIETQSINFNPNHPSIDPYKIFPSKSTTFGKYTGD